MAYLRELPNATKTTTTPTTYKSTPNGGEPVDAYGKVVVRTNSDGTQTAVARSSSSTAKAVADSINKTGNVSTELLNKLDGYVEPKKNVTVKSSGSSGSSSSDSIGTISLAPVGGYSIPAAEGYTVTPYDPATDSAYQQALAALDSAYGNKPVYANSYEAQINDIYNRIMNRDKFSYDVTADPLYQQYRESYVNQGQLAMRDTMGQAAALTGGYGSSYSQAVGQQQYNAYLQRLGDVIPELYDRAYGRYQDETADLYNQYNLTQGLAQDEYGKYVDQLGEYWNNVNYLANQADNIYDRNATNYWNAENLNFENYWNKMNYNLSAMSKSGSSGGSSKIVLGSSSSSGSGSSSKSADKNSNAYTTAEYNSFVKQLDSYSNVKTTSAAENGDGKYYAGVGTSTAAGSSRTSPTTTSATALRVKEIEDKRQKGYITNDQAEKLMDKYNISEHTYLYYNGLV
ncbi:MAG: hypothetical protein KBS59_08125, partial [Clostridiales bacterium]|nr:hypothetical protein [Clostridiales bacterium]